MSMRTLRNLFAPGVALTIFLTAASLPAATRKKQPPKPAAEECFACHSDATLSHEVNGKPVSLHVDPQGFKNSIHGSMFTCVDCHTDVKSSAHETPPKKSLAPIVTPIEQAAYDRSFHAKAMQGGNANAATCVDCHGSPHELLPASDPKSRVHHTNIPATCGACHGQKFVMQDGGQSAQMVASYQQSVHGHAVADGSEKAAVCTDCHGTHEILDAKDAKSPIFKFNVPYTCGKCHDTISREFKQSIHGQAVAQGKLAGAGVHRLPRHSLHQGAHRSKLARFGAKCRPRPLARAATKAVRLSQEFGVEGRRETTYLASYHGLASS